MHSATRPKMLLKIAPKLFSIAIYQTMEHKMDKEVLNNGISYFLAPLLNWTLAGVIRFLLVEIQRRAYAYVTTRISPICGAEQRVPGIASCQ